LGILGKVFIERITKQERCMYVQRARVRGFEKAGSAHEY
jgi:hypothetical protein